MTKTRDLSDFLIEGGADLPLGKPHIVPDVLYPAYVASGTSPKLLDGTTTHGTGTYNGVAVSTDYGTVQADGRKYYYTNIAGSKPIKDPRIGGHFGSQRHRVSSTQLLEQETATQGNPVYSIDGREWMRAVETVGTQGEAFFEINNDDGHRFQLGNGSAQQAFVEITGYFSDVNILGAGISSTQTVTTQIDGATASSNNLFSASVNDPKKDRYVNPNTVANLGLGATLGIHTLRINSNAKENTFSGIELIAQDTSNRNNIQIPSQNVVSYGKKFTVSGTPHYNPFNGYTTTTSFSSVVDVDTSLGLEAWKHTDNNYYPPVNGGRVVKWVDSSGTIKTSVTLMPPNATGISSFSSNPRDPNYGSWSSQYQPTFKNETERQLHEVAKTFHWREFGNGSANGDSNYADATMIENSADDDIAYIMDDGLTSYSGKDVDKHATYDAWDLVSAGETAYYTFIGTGFSIKNVNTATLTYTYDIYVDGVLVASDVTLNDYTWVNLCQNLPYGTHIIRFDNSGTSGTEVATFSEVSFHQPKRPPIPEDACVLADYMLMADTVSVSGSVDINRHISKGVRRISASRDFFYDASSGTPSLSLNVDYPSGYIQSHSGSINGGICKVPYFGTNYQPISMSGKYSTVDKGGSTNVSVTEIGSTAPLLLTSSAHTLGLFDGQTDKTSSGDFFNFGAEIATPIHTSSHYQSFETPFLHELVGGDRNMEQTNLVVSPDGKTWDEVTRDTSYMGGLGINTDVSTTQNTVVNILFTEWRGSVQGAKFYNKGFAIAYDRAICLKAGRYRMFYSTHGDSATNSNWSEIRVNGKEVVIYYTWGSSYTNPIIECVVDLVRGDYVQVLGTAKGDLDNQAIFNIEQV